MLCWLRRIISGKTNDLIRRYLGSQCRDVRREQQLVAELKRSSKDLDCRLLATHASPNKQITRREENVLVTNILATLPEDYREVLILRHLEGLSFHEVAQRMERSVDSVKKLWKRGLARLRGSMTRVP